MSPPKCILMATLLSANRFLNSHLPSILSSNAGKVALDRSSLGRTEANVTLALMRWSSFHRLTRDFAQNTPRNPIGKSAGERENHRLHRFTQMTQIQKQRG